MSDSNLYKYCMGFMYGAIFAIVIIIFVKNSKDNDLVEESCKEHSGVLVRKTPTTVVCNDFTTWEYQEGFLKKK